MILLSKVFLLAVICLLLRFLMWSSNRFIDASTLLRTPASSLPPSLLDTYVSLRHLWDRHEFSCSLVHMLEFFFGPLYGWPRVSYERNSPGDKSLLYSLISSSFLAILRYCFFLIFSFITACLMVSASNTLWYL